MARATATSGNVRQKSNPRASAPALSQARALVTFPSELGWMALVTNCRAVERVTFGHATPREAIATLGDAEAMMAARVKWIDRLVRRLQAYAERGADDFRDVPIVDQSATKFQARVLAACRRIPYGRTRSYAELALATGCPGAARAVGNVMACNELPLIIPCHRVIAAGGRLGGYSNRLGPEIKKHLLSLEATNPISKSSRG